MARPTIKGVRGALAKQLDRERKQGRRAKVKAARGEIRAAKVDRKSGIRAAAERCSVDRGRQKARIARERAELAEKSKREREVNRGICTDRRERVRKSASERIAQAQSVIDEERREQRFARTWSEPVMLGPRGARGAAGGQRAADLRRESDDEVRRNLPPELHRVWDRYKSRFPQNESHRSRTEAFEEWAAEHRSLVDEEIARDLERGLDEILATEEQDYADRQYWRGDQQGGDGVGAVEVRDLARGEQPSGRADVLLEYGVMAEAGGWLPVLWENGLPSWNWGRPYDRDVAIQMAKRELAERIERFSGDWSIEVRDRGEVDRATVDRDARTARQRRGVGQEVGGPGDASWQSEGRAWLGKVPVRRVPSDLIDRAYAQLRGGDRARFDQARGAVLRALQRDALGREVGASPARYYPRENKGFAARAGTTDRRSRAPAAVVPQSVGGGRNVKARLFANDLSAMLALSDQRKRENAAARELAQANPQLRSALEVDAKRRGLPGIDWPGYFRNAGISGVGAEQLSLLDQAARDPVARRERRSAAPGAPFALSLTEKPKRAAVQRRSGDLFSAVPKKKEGASAVFDLADAAMLIEEWKDKHDRGAPGYTRLSQQPNRAAVYELIEAHKEAQRAPGRTVVLVSKKTAQTIRDVFRALQSTTGKYGGVPAKIEAERRSLADILDHIKFALRQLSL